MFRLTTIEGMTWMKNNILSIKNIPDSKVHGANMGTTWVLSAPGGSHVGLMNPAIWDEM